MKKYIPFCLLILIGCGVPQSNYEELQIENVHLKEKINELENTSKQVEYINNHSEVVIPNTSLREITSQYNGQTYKIKIKFPKDYDKETDNYPVLYVTDAETNFGGISYIVQRLIKDRLIPKILVVGIAYGTDYDNFYRLRSRDLTPIEDKSLRIGGRNGEVHPTGGANNFSKFMEEELFPFMENNFRVQADQRALYGHSYGGLFGSYVFLKKPHLFNKYLLLSASLWFKNEIMIDEVKAIKNELTPTRLYMGAGELEGRLDDMQVEFMEIIQSKNIKNLDLKSEVLENETHRTIFGPGFTNGLRFIYNSSE